MALYLMTLNPDETLQPKDKKHKPLKTLNIKALLLLWGLGWLSIVRDSELNIIKNKKKIKKIFL